MEISENEITKLEHGFFKYKNLILVRAIRTGVKMSIITHDAPASGWFMRPKGGFSGCENKGFETKTYFTVLDSERSEEANIIEMEEFIKNGYCRLTVTNDFLQYARQLALIL